MHAVIILMSNKNYPLTLENCHSIKPILDKNQINITNIIEIYPEQCFHIHCDMSGDLVKIQNEIKDFIAPNPIDIAVLDNHNRQKKLVISDMDSTMIQQECIDELADFINKKTEISAITERAMQGELNFEESLTARVALLEGLDKSSLQNCFDNKIIMMSGAIQALDYMNSRNIKTILVSGGFTFFAEKVADKLGFDEYYANILEFDKTGEKLSGTVTHPILGREAKLEIMTQKAKEYALTLDDCLAIGDGANDLAMIQAAGLGVAYHAKPAVAQAARVAINHCDLKALIFLQAQQ